MQQQPCRIQSQLHVRDAVRNRLMAAERLAELSPLLCERHDLVELPIHDAEVLRGQASALPAHRDAEDRGPAALWADAVGLVHRALLEPHLAPGALASLHGRRGAQKVALAVERPLLQEQLGAGQHAPERQARRVARAGAGLAGAAATGIRSARNALPMPRLSTPCRAQIALARAIGVITRLVVIEKSIAA